VLVKKLLMLLLIAFVGAGIAFGASTVFFSTSSDEVDRVEPEGLIDESAPPAPTQAPSPSPSASPKPGGGTTGGSGVASAAGLAADSGSGPRIPSGGGTSTTSKKGVVVEDGIDEGECDEDTEAEREACIDDLEAEQEADEDEAEQEQEEAEDKAEEEADSNNN
jgi:hypothetical protein